MLESHQPDEQMTGAPERQPCLRSSAQEFLVQALYDYRDGKTRFAVVHCITAIELLLKARLAAIHPTLVFQKLTPKMFVTALRSRWPTCLSALRTLALP